MSKIENNKDHLVRTFDVIAVIGLSILTMLLVLVLVILVTGAYDFAKEFIRAMYNQ